MGAEGNLDLNFTFKFFESFILASFLSGSSEDRNQNIIVSPSQQAAWLISPIGGRRY